MPGVRIRHPQSGAATFTIMAPDRPYHEPIACMRCGRLHDVKTYHLELDDQGSIIVSETIWEMLQQIPGQPFELVGTVKKPPPIVLDLRAEIDMQKPLISHEENS